MERKVLKASEGMVLTNGEVYGKTIYIADDAYESDFTEITQAQYDEVLTKEVENFENMCR